VRDELIPAHAATASHAVRQATPHSPCWWFHPESVESALTVMLLLLLQNSGCLCCCCCCCCHSCCSRHGCCCCCCCCCCWWCSDGVRQPEVHSCLLKVQGGSSYVVVNSPGGQRAAERHPHGTFHGIPSRACTPGSLCVWTVCVHDNLCMYACTVCLCVCLCAVCATTCVCMTMVCFGMVLQ